VDVAKIQVSWLCDTGGKARRHWWQPQNGKDRTGPTEKAGQKQQQSSNKKEGIRIVGQGRER